MLRALRSTANEAGAFVRQAWLLRQDVRAPVVPTEVAASEQVVVFLHGLFATAGVLRPMRRRVGRHDGVHTATLTYPPGPGLDAISDRLRALCDQLPGDARVHLVGHSLGGIAARFYAVTAGDPRVVSTVALGSPFGGIRGASLLGFAGARDLDPDSLPLRRIRLHAHARGEDERQVPHLSIVAGADAFVRSPASHVLAGAESVVLEGRGHNTLLFDREAIRLVERHVLAYRPA